MVANRTDHLIHKTNIEPFINKYLQTFQRISNFETNRLIEIQILIQLNQFKAVVSAPYRIKSEYNFLKSMLNIFKILKVSKSIHISVVIDCHI